MAQMRRKDRKLEKKESLEILRNGEYGVLASISVDNKPQATPLNYCLLDNSIFFHSALKGEKLDNIRNNCHVSFTVVGTTELLPSQFGTYYESVIVTGKAKEINDTEKRDALMGLVRKYSTDYLAEGKEYIDQSINQTAVYEILIEQISGKSRKKTSKS